MTSIICHSLKRRTRSRPRHRTNMYFNALLYISLLKQAGRQAEAQSLKNFYRGVGLVTP